MPSIELMVLDPLAESDREFSHRTLSAVDLATDAATIVALALPLPIAGGRVDLCLLTPVALTLGDLRIETADGDPVWRLEGEWDGLLPDGSPAIPTTDGRVLLAGAPTLQSLRLQLPAGAQAGDFRAAHLHLTVCLLPEGQAVREAGAAIGRRDRALAEAQGRVRALSEDHDRLLSLRAHVQTAQNRVIALEHEHLRLLAAQEWLENQLADSELQSGDARRQLAGLTAQLAKTTEDFNRVAGELARIRGSIAWRLTWPLRRLLRLPAWILWRMIGVMGVIWRRLPAGLRLRIKTRIREQFPGLMRRLTGRTPGATTAITIHPPQELAIPGGVATDPLVSVVIPVYGKSDYSVICLDAIARAMPAAPIEIILVDDASPDDTQARLGGRADIRYVRNPENLGFIGSCNHGAALARAPFVMFLNNDTAVQPGWLDHLLDTLRREPAAALAGSQLLYPTGQLQEAGGIIWADASGWNWGRLGDPSAPQFNFRRTVDYISGAAILLPTALFRALGGFDSLYRPAYYEDTDLAFKLRALGLGVVYQPLSRVVHFEGITSGTDLNAGIKAYQRVNQDKFRARWAPLLRDQGMADQTLPGLPRDYFTDRTVRARALIIDACTPTPDQDSGSIDMVNLMRILLDFGIRVSFIPESNFAYFGRYTDDLQKMGVECLHAPQVNGVLPFLKARGAEFDLVILTRRDVAAPYMPAVRRHCPRARILFNTVDLHFLREAREAALHGRPDDSEALRRSKQRELSLVAQADATIVVSTHEAELLARELPTATIATVPVIREIPGRQAPGPGRRDILFVGGFNHPPNLDAVEWFIAEILPLVHQTLPDLRFHIVGSRLPDRIAALGAPPDRPGSAPVIVHGFVEDLTALFTQCRLSIAPLRYGAGIKGKVATSLGYGVPCVATPIAVEGTGMVDGGEVLVAGDAAGFAAAIIRLYRDDTLWQSLSEAGLAFVEANYALAANRGRVAALLSAVGAPPFAGSCPVCGHHGAFAVGPEGADWQAAGCTSCGTTAQQRGLTATLLHRTGRSRLSDLPDAGRIRHAACAAGFGDRLTAAGIVPLADPDRDLAGILVGRWPDLAGLRQLADRLGAEGWLVVADNPATNLPAIDHALAAGGHFRGAGLAFRKASPAAGQEGAVWLAWRYRPAGTDDPDAASPDAWFPVEAVAPG